MEPTLMVVGLNHRSAPLDMRERFWIGENARYSAMRQLKNAEGIEEAVIFSTRCRTEFLLWADEPTLAANSLLHYLSVHHGLRLSEWEHFYRRLDEAAVAHIFRLASSLDCQLLCPTDASACLLAAWEQARTVGACGPYLNALLQKAVSVSERGRRETALAKLRVSAPNAALELARQIFGTLEGRKILLLGAGDLNELSAPMVAGCAGESLVVMDQSQARAQELADRLGGTTATFGDRWRCLLRADVVICATGCPHFLLTREEAERIADERNRVALVIIDLGMPRDVDPEVRRVDGILLYDVQGLERTVKNRQAERVAAIAEAEKILAAEVQAFRGRLRAEVVAPTTVALRHRLDEICRQELESFIEERGPFTREEDQSLRAVTAQVSQRIANSLARELKGFSEKEEQERMAVAVSRLFHLNSPQQALAGANLENRKNEPHSENQSPVVINY